MALDVSSFKPGATLACSVTKAPRTPDMAATIARLPVPIATTLPAPSASFLTAYFRTTVTVPAVPAGKAVVLHHVIDDGAIFYVDGVRALDYNAPTNPAPILSTYLAPGTAPGDGDAREVTSSVSLSAGTHTIASTSAVSSVDVTPVVA